MFNSFNADNGGSFKKNYCVFLSVELKQEKKNSESAKIFMAAITLKKLYPFQLI